MTDVSGVWLDVLMYATTVLHWPLAMIEEMPATRIVFLVSEIEARRREIAKDG